MKFKPLESNLVKILVDTTNYVLQNDLTQVSPDGINTLHVKPVQVQAMFKAMYLYNMIVKKIKEEKKSETEHTN